MRTIFSAWNSTISNSHIFSSSFFSFCHISTTTNDRRRKFNQRMTYTLATVTFTHTHIRPIKRNSPHGREKKIRNQTIVLFSVGVLVRDLSFSVCHTIRNEFNNSFVRRNRYYHDTLNVIDSLDEQIEFFVPFNRTIDSTDLWATNGWNRKRTTTRPQKKQPKQTHNKKVLLFSSFLLRDKQRIGDISKWPALCHSL